MNTDTYASAAVALSDRRTSPAPPTGVRSTTPTAGGGR